MTLTSIYALIVTHNKPNIVTMTIWLPELTSDGPRYRAIADAIATARSKGELTAGTKLPPHRDLADTLGVTTGTVTRAYGEAARRGLVRGEVGRGTYVLPCQGDPIAVYQRRENDSELIDFMVNAPPSPRGGLHATAPVDFLRRVADRGYVDELFEYQPSGGTLRQRALGAAWLESRGVTDAEGRTLIALGGQQALAVTCMAELSAGDHVATADLTYTGLKTLAHHQELRLVGLSHDEEGILPDALRAACRSRRLSALYVIPNIHNPTSATLSLERREEIVAIAREHDLAIIEDDSNGPLLTDPLPPLAALAPERTFYLCTLSKAIGPGLRLAYIVAPKKTTGCMEMAIRTSTWMATPLMVEMASAWIEDGTLEKLIEEKRQETRVRQELALELLGDTPCATTDTSQFLWIPLPRHDGDTKADGDLVCGPCWRSDEFARHAKAQGVRVAPCSIFSVGRSDWPDAIRITLPEPDLLRTGLTTLVDLLAQAPAPGEVMA
ncbi:MAG: PLP-dependent aminotransferase family protein [Acidobacteriota bacterium]